MQYNRNIISARIRRILINNLTQPIKLNPKSGLTPAAVLIPLVISNNLISVLFTKRTQDVKDHQGQISFPGGAIEIQDKSAKDAALRETREEIGIKSTDVEIVGALPPRGTITGYFIYPFVGILNEHLNLILNQGEVEKTLLVPLRWLADEKNSKVEMYARPGVKRHPVIFYKKYHGELIWGITASILLEFTKKIKNSEEKVSSLLH